MIRAAPGTVGGEAHTLGYQGVDRVAQQDLGQGVLPIVGSEEPLDSLIRELEELVSGEAGLVLLDLVFYPIEVASAGRGEGIGHVEQWYRAGAIRTRGDRIFSGVFRVR